MEWMEVVNVNCRGRTEIISAIWNRKIIIVIKSASMLSIGNVKICKFGLKNHLNRNTIPEILIN